LIPGQSTRDMCWTKWHRGRFPSEYFSYFPSSIIGEIQTSNIANCNMVNDHLTPGNTVVPLKLKDLANFNLRQGLLSGLFSPQVSSPKPCICLSSPHMCNMPHPSHSSWSLRYYLKSTDYEAHYAIYSSPLLSHPS